MIILLDGIDACGKTGHARRLAEKLGARLFEFPNYTSATGQLIRAHLQSRWFADWVDNLRAEITYPEDKILDAIVFQALQTVNRLEVASEIEAAATEVDVVLARYWPSAYVYGVMDKLSAEWLLKIHESLPQPDVCILLDIDAKDSFERRPENRDRYEADPIFLDACAELYRGLWNQEPTFLSHGCFWATVDARSSKEEVAARIDKVIADVRAAQ